MTQSISLQRTGKFDLAVFLHDQRVAARITTARRGGPVRTIINGRHRKPTGRYASRKARRSLPWEARDERDYFWVCESDAAVVDYLSQPHRLSIRMPSGPDLIYYPDVRRHMASGQVEIVEIKKDNVPSSRLHDPDYTLKLELARQVYAGLRWSFSVVTGEQLRRGYALRTAYDIQRNRFAQTDTRDVVTVLAAISSGGGALDVEEAVEVLGGTPHARAKLRSLVVQRVLSVDLSQTLDGYALVRAAPRSVPGAWLDGA